MTREARMATMTVDEVLARLTALEDPRMRAVNERHGDDHGVNLTKLRALAKEVRTDHAFARELWATGATAARLVALLVCRPKEFSREELDLPGLLDVIEAEMKDAPDRLQWAMNTCLATIGIEHPEHRERVLAIGNRLEVLKDYPTPPGCTSPYVPLWVEEIVRRRSA